MNCHLLAIAFLAKLYLELQVNVGGSLVKNPGDIDPHWSQLVKT